MNYITTTQLRTEATKLVAALGSGEEVSLIHRSKVIGTISPRGKTAIPIESISQLRAFLRKIVPKIRLSAGKRAEIYSQHLKKKYG